MKKFEPTFVAFARFLAHLICTTSVTFQEFLNTIRPFCIRMFCHVQLQSAL